PTMSARRLPVVSARNRGCRSVRHDPALYPKLLTTSCGAHPRCPGVKPQTVNVLPFIRHGTPPSAAQFSQLPLASPYRPKAPPHVHLLSAYSSGQPKMCPVSCANTRSMLSGPQPSLL